MSETSAQSHKRLSHESRRKMKLNQRLHKTGLGSYLLILLNNPTKWTITGEDGEKQVIRELGEVAKGCL